MSADCNCPCHSEDDMTCDDWEEPIDLGVGQCETMVRSRGWGPSWPRLHQCLNETRNMPRYCWRHRAQERVGMR